MTNSVEHPLPCCQLVDLLVESSYSKQIKTIGFAIAIIVGLGGMALIGVGVSGICQWGAFKVLTVQQAFVLLSLGVFLGPIPLVLGIVGAVKTRQLLSPLGSEIWRYYGADIPFGDPLLPDNLSQIMNADCPFWLGKKVRETHILMLVPQHVNTNDPLTLNRLEQLLVQSQRGLNVQSFADPVRQTIGDQLNQRAGWVLMTRKVIPGSLGVPHGGDDQAYHLPNGYRLPTAIEAASCIALEYASSRTRLFNMVSIRCNDVIDQARVTVGGWRGDNRNGGLNFAHAHDNGEVRELGVAAIRIL